MRITCIIATCGDSAWRDLAYSRAYPSVMHQDVQTIVYHEDNGSVARARNLAARAAADSDWLCFLDADDELEPGYFAAMRERWILGAITTDWSPLLAPSLRQIGEHTETFLGIPQKGRWPELNECVIGTLVPRHAFVAVGGFREFSSLEDYDLFLRCFDAGCQLVHVPDAVYRQHMRAGSRNADQSPYGRIWAEHLERVAT